MMISTIPRIYTALAEWLGCLIYILIIRRKKINVKFIIIAALFFIIQTAWQLVSGILPIFMWVPAMIIAFALMYVFVLVNSGANFYESGYYCVRAFVLAEFAASIEWQIYCAIGKRIAFFSNRIIELFFVLLVFAIIFIVYYLIEKKQIKESEIEVSRKDLIASCVVAIAIFSVSNLNFLLSDISSSNYLNQVFFVRTLVDVCGLMILFSQRQSKRWLQAKFEMNLMQNIINKQYNQYCLSKENIELLNAKFHDMKHQIVAIRAEKNSQHIDNLLAEMESGIRKYEAENKTGNAVLDVILTGKSLQCEKEKINFTCVVDGKLLDFIEVADLCSIFGNALDNAIESIQKIDEIDKKIIKLAVFSKEDHILIKISNYYTEILEYDNNELKTSKTDKNFHGYGLKSIRQCVEKYGGSLNINCANNWFTLFILFDKEKAKAQK